MFHQSNGNDHWPTENLIPEDSNNHFYFQGFSTKLLYILKSNQCSVFGNFLNRIQLSNI
jgi:hypothetical protein